MAKQNLSVKTHMIMSLTSVLHLLLFPFVLVDPDFLHFAWLTGVVHETMHHTFGP